MSSHLALRSLRSRTTVLGNTVLILCPFLVPHRIGPLVSNTIPFRSSIYENSLEERVIGCKITKPRS
jgi:hypothetical protein